MRRKDSVAAQMHVVKVPTQVKELFPYAHYADKGHRPLMTVHPNGNEVLLVCRDWFKLKPNVQQAPRTRVDIYMPGEAGVLIAQEIIKIVGSGSLAELNYTDPEEFRAGAQTLPKIDESRSVLYELTMMIIAGYQISGQMGIIYIDLERPNEGHIEMKGPEIHLGIPLQNVQGIKDHAQIRHVNIPESELRVKGEKNPVPKALGDIRIVLSQDSARNLAATLIYYANLERSESVC